MFQKRAVDVDKFLDAAYLDPDTGGIITQCTQKLIAVSKLVNAVDTCIEIYFVRLLLSDKSDLG